MPDSIKSVTFGPVKVCDIDDCDRPCKAKGLCSTHYARLRRTGDPTTTRQPGRPRDETRGKAEQVMRQGGVWSDRTFARYWRAHRILYDLYGPDAAHQAVLRASRPNGSLNAAQLTREADAALFRWIDENPES
jgi:hypothetical protein